MNFNPGTRTRIRLAMTLDFDPTGSDLELKIGDTWYPCVWEGASVEDVVAGEWTQEARTVNYFAGPAVAVLAGAIPLTDERYYTETRVTSGTDVITEDGPYIDLD